jgi:hypothetical protein
MKIRSHNRPRRELQRPGCGILWNNVDAGIGPNPSRLEMIMKLRTLVLLLLAALVAGPALAHGDKKHVIDTVEKASADSVTVKIADGTSVEVKLVATTTYILRSRNVDKPAKASDLVVGDRVVIHATPKGDTLEAAEVRFSAPGTATAGAAPKPKS